MQEEKMLSLKNTPRGVASSCAVYRDADAQSYRGSVDQTGLVSWTTFRANMDKIKSETLEYD